VILGYRTFPDGKVEDQVDDIAKAVEYFQNKYGSGIGGGRPPVVLMGHSSGAHIAMLAVLRGKLSSVDAIVAASGVYDCLAQVEHEQVLGIDQLSPLTPAAGMSEENMQANSPSWLISQAKEGEIQDIPPVLLVHGEDDTVVLSSASKLFYKQLQETGVPKRPDL
jgi:acetyl esterase/lipase